MVRLFYATKCTQAAGVDSRTKRRMRFGNWRGLAEHERYFASAAQFAFPRRTRNATGQFWRMDRRDRQELLRACAARTRRAEAAVAGRWCGSESRRH